MTFAQLERLAGDGWLRNRAERRLGARIIVAPPRRFSNVSRVMLPGATKKAKHK